MIRMHVHNYSNPNPQPKSEYNGALSYLGGAGVGIHLLVKNGIRYLSQFGFPCDFQVSVHGFLNHPGNIGDIPNPYMKVQET